MIRLKAWNRARLAMCGLIALTAGQGVAADSCPATISVVNTPLTFYAEPEGKSGLLADLLVRNDGTSALTSVTSNIYFYQSGVNQLKDGRQSALALSVPPGAVWRFTLPFDVAAGDLPASGFVVLGAKAQDCAASAKQVLQPFTIPSQASVANSGRIVSFSGVLALLAFLVATVVFRAGLSKPMGASEWSFSASSATNLAVAGTLLTGVLASTVFPDYPHYLTKQGYWVLSLFFGILAGLAPVLYGFSTRPVGPNSTDPQALDFQGSVLTFLLSAALTVWAVLGQLATLSVLLNEFAISRSIAPASVSGEILLAVSVAIALIVYCYRAAKFYIEEHPARQVEPAAAAQNETAKVLRAPNWTAF
jgi:hypothetical protein